MDVRSYRTKDGFVEPFVLSQLLDWLKLLTIEDMPPEALRSQDNKTAIPPLYGALLKNEQDVHLFERLAFLTRRKV